MPSPCAKVAVFALRYQEGSRANERHGLPSGEAQLRLSYQQHQCLYLLLALLGAIIVLDSNEYHFCHCIDGKCT